MLYKNKEYLPHMYVFILFCSFVGADATTHEYCHHLIFSKYQKYFGGFFWVRKKDKEYLHYTYEFVSLSYSKLTIGHECNSKKNLKHRTLRISL